MKDEEMKTIGLFGAFLLLFFSVSVGCARDIKHIQRDRTDFSEVKAIPAEKVLSLSVHVLATVKPHVAERLRMALKEKLEDDLFSTVLIGKTKSEGRNADLRLDVYTDTYCSVHEIGIFHSSLDYAKVSLRIVLSDLKNGKVLLKGRVESFKSSQDAGILDLKTRKELLEKASDEALRKIANEIRVHIAEEEALLEGLESYEGKGPRPRAAVLDLENTTRESKAQGYGESATIMLYTALDTIGRFVIVERQKIRDVAREHSLNLSGLIDRDTAKKMGKLLGVEYMLTGGVSAFSGRLEIDLRLVDTGTGEVVQTETGKVKTERDLRKLVNTLASRMSKKFKENEKER